MKRFLVAAALCAVAPLHAYTQTRTYVAYMGTYNSTTKYTVSDTVTYAGSTYISLAINNIGNTPGTSSGSWAVYGSVTTSSSSGSSSGSGSGTQGAQGVQGAAGSAATVTIGTVTTLAAGSQATVTNAGTSNAAILNFGLPGVSADQVTAFGKALQVNQDGSVVNPPASPLALPAGLNTSDTSGMAGIDALQPGTGTRPMPGLGWTGFGGQASLNAPAWQVILPGMTTTSDTVWVIGPAAAAATSLDGTPGYASQARPFTVGGTGTTFLTNAGADASFNTLHVVDNTDTGAMPDGGVFALSSFVPGATGGGISMAWGKGCQGYNGYANPYDAFKFTIGMYGSGNASNYMLFGFCGAPLWTLGADGSLSGPSNNVTFGPDGKVVSQKAVVAVNGFETISTYAVGATCPLDGGAVMAVAGLTTHGNLAICVANTIVAAVLSSSASN